MAFQANGHQLAILGPDGQPYRRPVVNGDIRSDPAAYRDRPPSFALPAHLASASIFGGPSRTYWHDRFDEALRNSREDAHAFKRDSRIKALLNERKRSVMHLKWHIDVPDVNDPDQKLVRDVVTKAIESIHDFLDVKSCLLEDIWYGKYAVQWVWGKKWFNGVRTKGPLRWEPLHGDKIGYQWQDDGSPDIPYVLVHGGSVGFLKDRGGEVIPTTMGLSLLLKRHWRGRFTIAHHEIEDWDFWDGQQALMKHGVGLRSHVYWTEYLRKEIESWITDFMERVGLGVTMWKYESGNAQALAEAQTAAKAYDRRVNLFVPCWSDGSGKLLGGVERYDPPLAGSEFLKTLMEYFDRQIERLFVGQEGSSKGMSAGLGNEATADLMKDTKGMITKEDAERFGSALTGDEWNPSLVNQIVRWTEWPNPAMGTLPARMIFGVESTASRDKMVGLRQLFDMGIDFRKADGLEAVGIVAPVHGDATCVNEELKAKTKQAELQTQQMAAGGQPGQQPGAAPAEGVPQQQAGQEQPEGGQEELLSGPFIDWLKRGQEESPSEDEAVGYLRRGKPIFYEGGTRKWRQESLPDANPDAESLRWVNSETGGEEYKLKGEDPNLGRGETGAPEETESEEKATAEAKAVPKKAAKPSPANEALRKLGQLDKDNAPIEAVASVLSDFKKLSPDDFIQVRDLMKRSGITFSPRKPEDASSAIIDAVQKRRKRIKESSPEELKAGAERLKAKGVNLLSKEERDNPEAVRKHFLNNFDRILKGRDDLQVRKDLEQIGIGLPANADREQMKQATADYMASRAAVRNLFKNPTAAALAEQVPPEMAKAEAPAIRTGTKQAAKLDTSAEAPMQQIPFDEEKAQKEFEDSFKSKSPEEQKAVLDRARKDYLTAHPELAGQKEFHDWLRSAPSDPAQMEEWQKTHPKPETGPKPADQSGPGKPTSDLDEPRKALGMGPAVREVPAKEAAGQKPPTEQGSSTVAPEAAATPAKPVLSAKMAAHKEALLSRKKDKATRKADIERRIAEASKAKQASGQPAVSDMGELLKKIRAVVGEVKPGQGSKGEEKPEGRTSRYEGAEAKPAPHAPEGELSAEDKAVWQKAHDAAMGDSKAVEDEMRAKGLNSPADYANAKLVEAQKARPKGGIHATPEISGKGGVQPERQGNETRGTPVEASTRGQLQGEKAGGGKEGPQEGVKRQEVAAGQAGLSAQVDGRSVKFVPHEKAGPDETTVMVDPKKLDAARPAEPVAPAEKADPVQKAASAPSAAPQRRAPVGVHRAPVKDLYVDPERFQYKLNMGEGRVGQELKGGVQFDPDLSGVVSVWRDPADGKDYIVNGHHRYELAERSGRPDIDVKYIDAVDAKEARAKGALQNIAEGRGTSVDAAKFMRDLGFTPEELSSKNVSIKGKVAAEAAGLINLNDRLFHKVSIGQMDPAEAAAIGSKLKNHEAQDLLARRLEEEEQKTGKPVHPRIIDRMADALANQIAQAPTGGEAGTAQKSLFGDETDAGGRNLFLERAEVADHVGQALAKEMHDFQAVASKRRAERVGETGNVLNVEENKIAAKKAEQERNAYNTLVDRKGPVSDAINQVTEAYANARTRAEKQRVLRDGVPRVREAVAAALGGSGETGTALSEAVAGGTPGVAPGTGGTPEAGEGTRRAETAGPAAEVTPESVPQPSAAHETGQPTESARVSEAANKARGLLDEINSGNVTSQRIDALMSEFGGLSKPELDGLLAKMKIAGKSPSKADAIRKIRAVLGSQLEMHVKGTTFESSTPQAKPAAEVQPEQSKAGADLFGNPTGPAVKPLFGGAASDKKQGREGALRDVSAVRKRNPDAWDMPQEVKGGTGDQFYVTHLPTGNRVESDEFGKYVVKDKAGKKLAGPFETAEQAAGFIEKGQGPTHYARPAGTRKHIIRDKDTGLIDDIVESTFAVEPVQYARRQVGVRKKIVRDPKTRLIVDIVEVPVFEDET